MGAGRGGGGGGGGAGCVSHSPLFLFLNSPSPLFRWPPPKKLNRLRHGSPEGPESDSWAQMVEEENACHCPLTTHDIAQQACAYMCAHTTLLCTCIYTHTYIQLKSYSLVSSQGAIKNWGHWRIDSEDRVSPVLCTHHPSQSNPGDCLLLYQRVTEERQFPD